MIFSCKEEAGALKSAQSKKTHSIDQGVIPYDLDSVFNGLLVERFDSTITSHDRYNRDNKIYTEGASFRYSYVYIRHDKSYYYKPSVDGWELVPYHELDDKTVKDFIIKVPKTYRKGYPQTLLNYYYPPGLNYSSTGVIENPGNVWLHPPRRALFRILELNPFPYIKAPYKVGNKWEWTLRIGSHWSDDRWKT